MTSLLFALPIGWSLHRLTMHAMDTVQNPSPVLRWLRGVVARAASAENQGLGAAAHTAP